MYKYFSYFRFRYNRKKGMHLNVKNEVGKLQTVVLGIAKDFGGTPEPSACYDPKSLENVLNGTYPSEVDLVLSCYPSSFIDS